MIVTDGQQFNGFPDRAERLRLAILEREREREFERKFWEDARRMQRLVMVGLEPEFSEFGWVQFSECPKCGGDIVATYKVGSKGVFGWTVTECGECESELIYDLETGHSFQFGWGLPVDGDKPIGGGQ